jgi:hypothetical protein
VLAVWAHPNLSEEKRGAAAVALVEEALKQVKNTGTIADVKLMIQAANEAANQRVSKATGVEFINRVSRSRR